jgi:hypothetical protein
MLSPFRCLTCKNFNMCLVTFEDLLRLLYNHTVSINTADITQSEYNAKLIFLLYFGTKSHVTSVKTLYFDSKRVLHAILPPAKHGLPNRHYPGQFTYYLTYLFTPWSRFLLQKLTGLQVVKKFPTYYGTRRLITTFTSARHLSLS